MTVPVARWPVASAPARTALPDGSMPWPPTLVSRRVALVVFGTGLLFYTSLSGILVLAGLDVRTTVIAAQFIGLLGFALVIAGLLRIPLRQAFALRPAAPIHWAMALAAAIPLQAVGGSLQFTILRLFPEDSVVRRLMEDTVRQFVTTDTLADLIMLFLAAVVSAAICEEFLFRGLLLQLLERRSGWTSAIVFSAALFAVFHLNPIVLLPVGVVGAYLAVLVWRSGSLYPAMFAHALNNGLALFGTPLVLSEATYSRWVWLILGVSTAIFGVLFATYLRLTTAPPATRRPGALEGLDVGGGLGDGEQAEQAEQAEP